ncbi:MAG: DUF861 domain-containing protein [Chloroflexi bacterium]|nr:DUF861 domain-containing protein [Chloroflexota bacterium]
MTRQLFTASDIRRLANDQKSNLLIVAPDDLITPEAQDVARELGVQIRREEAASNAPAPATLPPLKVVRGANVVLEAFEPGASANTRLRDVITSGNGSPMGAGYMSLERGEFPWTLNYDEVDVVLEGELVITRGGERVRGGPGDCIFIPKGSTITFGTPGGVRFFYVTFPADWA